MPDTLFEIIKLNSSYSAMVSEYNHYSRRVESLKDRIKSSYKKRSLAYMEVYRLNTAKGGFHSNVNYYVNSKLDFISKISYSIRNNLYSLRDSRAILANYKAKLYGNFPLEAYCSSDLNTIINPDAFVKASKRFNYIRRASWKITNDKLLITFLTRSMVCRDIEHIQSPLILPPWKWQIEVGNTTTSGGSLELFVWSRDLYLCKPHPHISEGVLAHPRLYYDRVGSARRDGEIYTGNALCLGGLTKNSINIALKAGNYTLFWALLYKYMTSFNSNDDWGKETGYMREAMPSIEHHLKTKGDVIMRDNIVKHNEVLQWL